MTAPYQDTLQGQSYLGSGGRMAAGEATWSMSYSWILNVFLESCYIRTHRNRKHLHHDSAAPGMGHYGGRRERCPGNRQDTGLALVIIFCFILCYLIGNLSIILRLRVIYFFFLEMTSFLSGRYIITQKSQLVLFWFFGFGLFVCFGFGLGFLSIAK